MLRQDSRHCIQPIGAGQSLRLTHTQDDAEMSPTLASMMLLQRRLDNLSRSSDAAPAPTIPDTSHHHQFPAVECTVPTLPQIHLSEPHTDPATRGSFRPNISPSGKYC